VATGDETTPRTGSLPNSRSQYRRILQPFEAPFRPSERDGARRKDRGSGRTGRAPMSHPIKSSGRPSRNKMQYRSAPGTDCKISLGEDKTRREQGRNENAIYGRDGSVSSLFFVFRFPFLAFAWNTHGLRVQDVFITPRDIEGYIYLWPRDKGEVANKHVIAETRSKMNGQRD